MPAALDLSMLAESLRRDRGLAAKADIGTVTARLGLSGTSSIAVGDDCAVIPDSDGYTLFAIEGFMNEFVAADPWFAGWCGVMVNISDVAAMGGTPVAVVDAMWADGTASAQEILAGMRAAAERFGVPIVGGHTNLNSRCRQLSVAILGKAKRLLTSFDAKPGERLVTAVDLRGRYGAHFSNWEAATDAPGSRLRGDLALLPTIAEARLSKAAKDISQGGIVGTAAMLAECSNVGVTIDLGAIPQPSGVPLERWLKTFPSYGYLLAVAPENVSSVTRLFIDRGIAAADIGGFDASTCVEITDGAAVETIWDFSQQALLGCAAPKVPA